MITAIDTNVLLDVCLPDPRHGGASREMLRDCLSRGAGVVCEIVYSELACAFPSSQSLQEALRVLGVVLEPSTEMTLWRAAEIWRSVQKGQGLKPRRILPDFLIGAHAMVQADRLLTRDRGFYREYFKALRVVSP